MWCETRKFEQLSSRVESSREVDASHANHRNRGPQRIAPIGHKTRSFVCFKLSRRFADRPSQSGYQHLWADWVDRGSIECRHVGTDDRWPNGQASRTKRSTMHSGPLGTNSSKTPLSYADDPLASAYFRPSPLTDLARQHDLVHDVRTELDRIIPPQDQPGGHNALAVGLDMDRLPGDILPLILSKLRYRLGDLYACARVSRLWNSVAQPLLHERIVLYVSSADCSICSFSFCFFPPDWLS